jgi:molybdopterin-binding protein
VRLSARNRFKGVIEGVEEGIITSRIKIKVQTPIVITAVITKDAVKELELKRGDKVEAIIKSSSVMVAKE